MTVLVKKSLKHCFKRPPLRYVVSRDLDVYRR